MGPAFRPWCTLGDPSEFEIIFKILGTLGAGSGGQVLLVECQISGRKFACKVTKVPTLKSGDECQQEDVSAPFSEACAVNEALIHAALQHPHIVPLQYVYQCPGWLMMVMEHTRAGSVIDYLCQCHPNGLPDALAHRWFTELCGAVEYLHQNGVAHRDLKPDNVLLFRNGSSDPTQWMTKLCDFGAAGSVLSADGEMSATVLSESSGTLQYAAPEVFEGSGHGLAADLWSLGVTLYVLLTGRMPFAGTTATEIVPQICSGNVLLPPMLVAKTNPLALDLVLKLLRVHPQERPTISEVLQHPWIRPFCQKQPRLVRRRSSIPECHRPVATKLPC